MAVCVQFLSVNLLLEEEVGSLYVIMKTLFVTSKRKTV